MKSVDCLHLLLSAACNVPRVMTPHLKPIEPKTPRWEPAADPSTITVPGLDTTASVNDQIEQIEQLITIKLQVSYPTRFHGYSSFVFLVLMHGV